MKTKVKFVVFKGELTALFPEELYNERVYGKKLITCYAHIGQHSSASRSLMRCKQAKKEQYQDLLNELKRQGYDNLHVINEEVKS